MRQLISVCGVVCVGTHVQKQLALFGPSKYNIIYISEQKYIVLYCGYTSSPSTRKNIMSNMFLQGPFGTRWMMSADVWNGWCAFFCRSFSHDTHQSSNSLGRNRREETWRNLPLGAKALFGATSARSSIYPLYNERSNEPTSTFSTYKPAPLAS